MTTIKINPMPIYSSFHSFFCINNRLSKHPNNPNFQHNADGVSSFHSRKFSLLYFSFNLFIRSCSLLISVPMLSALSRRAMFFSFKIRTNLPSFSINFSPHLPYTPQHFPHFLDDDKV